MAFFWSLFRSLIRESFSSRKSHACFINTTPCLSEPIKEEGDLWLPCFHRCEHTHEEQQPTSKPDNINKEACTHKHARCYKKKRLMSESPARLGWRLLGDTLLFAGQSCSVKLRHHRHRGQRHPSCGVHSALETTFGFVCLEMRMWGGSETPSDTKSSTEVIYILDIY